MKEKRKLSTTLIKVAVSLVLLILILSRIDKNLVVSYVSKINLYYFPLVLTFVILNYFISSIRWRKLLSIYGNNHISLFYLTKLYFIGAFFNNFLPTSIGGDFYKAYKLGSVISDHSKAFASTFMERFSGVLVLGILASYGLISTFGMLGVLIFFFL